MRRLLGLMAALTALALAVPTGAAADPQGDKQRLDRKIAQTQALYESVNSAAQAALQAYGQATAALPAAQARLADARGVLLARQVQAAQASRDAQAAQQVADSAAVRASDAATELTLARQRLAAFVTTVYQGGALLAFNAVLDAPSATDLADRVGYVNQLATLRRDTVAATARARDAADAALAAAATARDQAAAARQAAADALAAAQAAADAATADEAAVTALIATQAQAVAGADAQRAAVLAQYNELKAQSDRIEAQLRALAAASGARPRSGSGSGAGAPAPHAGKILITPVRGAWKSSDFGMRFDPYYKVWQLHAGVDLAAPGGTPIYAAAAGTVVRTGWYGGYGNYTCLSHGLYQGSGLSTCYGHQSRILVRPGQRVAQGTEIGLVGTTGASTGNHLHFEVRINGTPVQPLEWLPSCLC